MPKARRKILQITTSAAQAHPPRDLVLWYVRCTERAGQPLGQKSAANHSRAVASRLQQGAIQPQFVLVRSKEPLNGGPCVRRQPALHVRGQPLHFFPRGLGQTAREPRSEERRVGKECRS